MLCGNLTVSFDMDLHPANSLDDNQPLVDATQTQLKEIMRDPWDL